jgi:hypothetical protein
LESAGNSREFLSRTGTSLVSESGIHSKIIQDTHVVVTCFIPDEENTMSNNNNKNNTEFLRHEFLKIPCAPYS